MRGKATRTIANIVKTITGKKSVYTLYIYLNNVIFLYNNLHIYVFYQQEPFSVFCYFFGDIHGPR